MSAIDASKPTAGTALTADVRANFLAAKNEIDANTAAAAAALAAANAHAALTDNPHATTAAQVGADATGTAAAAVAAHVALGDPHTQYVLETTTVNGQALSGNVTITNIAGNAATVTTNADLTGPVTSTGNATAIANGAISNAMLANADVANLSGTNTGDNATNSQYSGLAASKQDTLVSGTNIKTVNSTSLLGAGDIAISASPGGSTLQLQYNNAGAFGGMSGSSWDNTNRALTQTGATVTTSNPVASYTQTWNAGAVTFTGWRLNITNTASAAASLLMDLQVGGTSVFNVDKNGAAAIVYGGGSGFNNHLTFNTSGNGFTTIGGYNSYFFVRSGVSGAHRLAVYSDSRTNRVGPAIPASNDYRWSSTSDATGSPDTGFERVSAGVVGVNDGSVGVWRDIKVRTYLADATITTAGTTGNQTINKSLGTVNFAAGATSLVVTNSIVTTSSIIFCTIRTNDTTALIKNVVPAAGSFTITLNAAATSETSVGFIVHNG